MHAWAWFWGSTAVGAFEISIPWTPSLCSVSHDFFPSTTRRGWGDIRPQSESIKPSASSESVAGATKRGWDFVPATDTRNKSWNLKEHEHTQIWLQGPRFSFVTLLISSLCLPKLLWFNPVVKELYFKRSQPIFFFKESIRYGLTTDWTFLSRHCYLVPCGAAYCFPKLLLKLRQNWSLDLSDYICVLWAVIKWSRLGTSTSSWW